ncbi:formylglycine-generating enzyme required for sulfatase activity [Sulfuritortus calidifontis]|uniref:Formylglycine-generating enzyme required for sulfatase activity n=1 Tax=Sulfuritortus calidifontis TaxID=1914471 RepID=A0A4R3JXN3_9PROT|nr:formylglycine-generating enzyme family protein [Sulfuritortus calidifontis]TCS73105.1 formylglycine-generating enzyme required for sulfatase activity [Sulfuritortus calidifontis]
MNERLAIDPTTYVHGLDIQGLRTLQAEAAQAAGLGVFFRDTLKDGSTGPELAVIPPGIFEMGAAEPERRFGDLPQRNTRIDRAFAIGRCTVTADEFQRFEEACGFFWQDHLLRGEGRQPVINIDLTTAQEYLDWLSLETGHRYRLPTEAEWEYAARAGSRSAYCYGEHLTCSEANVGSFAPPRQAVSGWRRFLPFCVPLNRAVEVGSYPPNLWGLYEVHGNVWEFTSDRWVGPIDALSRKPAQGDWRVTKGGSWFEGARDARAASRKPRFYHELDLNLGLRVVREL